LKHIKIVPNNQTMAALWIRNPTTGEQLTKELITIMPNIPVILCTGFSDENDEKHAMDLGVKGFLKKPVARGDLAEMVRKVLDEAKGPTSDLLSNS
jgi:DNA-binding NarL/FixJ family response regulator